MAFAATGSTAENRAFSEGPLKVQLMTWSAASGDTSGTVTCDRLSRVMHIFVSGGLKMTAAPTYTTNVATLAFADPGATVYGTIIAFGV